MLSQIDGRLPACIVDRGELIERGGVSEQVRIERIEARSIRHGQAVGGLRQGERVGYGRILRLEFSYPII